MTEQDNKIKPLKKGAVVYPKAYHVDPDNPDNSYVEGVTQGNQPIVAYIRVGAEHKERQDSDSKGRTLPSVKDLASKNPAAPRRCEAHANNGPDDPSRGILLIEQISKLEGEEASKHPGKFVCEAKWASILQQNDYMPAYTGQGYIEVSFRRGLDAEQKKLKAEFLGLKRRLENPSENKLDLKEQMQAIQSEMIQARQMFLTVVDMKIDEMVSVELSKLENLGPTDRLSALERRLKEMTEPMTNTGMYGGALLRLRNGDTVSPLYTSSFAMQYDFKNRKVVPFEDTFANWRKFDGQKLCGAFMKASPSMNLTLDIIPCQRINFGPKSLDPYKADILRGEASKTLKTYVDEDARDHVGVIDLTPNDYLASFMACRTALASEENRIISRAHSYTAPMVKAVLYGQDLTRYRMSSANGSSSEKSAQGSPAPAMAD